MEAKKLKVLKDVFVLSELSFFNNLTLEEKNNIPSKRVLDLSGCRNLFLKQEIVNYIFGKLNKNEMKLTTLSESASDYKRIAEFCSNLRKTSFTQMNKKEYIRKFEFFLSNNDIRTKTQISSRTISDLGNKKIVPSGIVAKFISIINFYQKVEVTSFQFENDIWPIELIPIKISGQLDSSKVNFLNFKQFKEEKIKNIIKKYIFQRLNNKKISTVADDLKILKRFYIFLEKEKINSLSFLTRGDIENFIGFVEMKLFADNTKRTTIQGIRHFLNTCYFNKWENAPGKILMADKDGTKKIKQKPNFIPNNVLRQLNEHLFLLEDIYSRMTFVIQNVGMRISELCLLTPGCIFKDDEGDFFLKYYQSKTETENNVPVSKEVAHILIKQEEDSKNKFGENVKYIFAKSDILPVSSKILNNKLNDLANKQNIVDEDGQVFHFNSHMFRATVATKYVNKGMEPNLIRKLIGHNSMKSINHYMEIHNHTLQREIKDILNIQDEMILKIGVTQEPKKYVANEGIPLPNGTCMKPITEGKCEHANACYSCTVFKPDKNDLNLFKIQLEETIINLEIAKKNGFERLIQVNEELKENLEKIIIKLKG